jgi:hypothetical protein
MPRRPGLLRSTRKQPAGTGNSSYGAKAAGARRGMPRPGKPGMGWSGKSAILKFRATRRR